MGWEFVNMRIDLSTSIYIANRHVFMLHSDHNDMNKTFHHTISMQTPTSIKTLIQQLKPVLGSILDSARNQFALLQAPLNLNTPGESLIPHQKTHAAYLTWKASQHQLSDNLYDEFCLQTAYM